MTTKTIFKDFLAGNYERAEEEFARVAKMRNWPACITGGRLTYHGTETLCYDVTLPRSLQAALVLIHAGRQAEVEPAVMELLSRCGLVDRDNVMTRHGYYKLVSGLALKDQVKALSLRYEELAIQSGNPMKTEELVRSSYLSAGYRAVHDEGGLLFALADAVLRPDSDKLKPLIGPDAWYRPTDDCFEAMVPYLGNFESIDPAGPRYVTPERKEALLAILGKASEARIAEGYRLHATAFANLPPMSGHVFSLDLLLDLFACIGANRLVALIAFRLDHPECGHGLADLTVFRDNELVLVETMRTDKLMFHQARTLHMMSQLPVDVVSDVRVVRVIAA